MCRRARGSRHTASKEKIAGSQGAYRSNSHRRQAHQPSGAAGPLSWTGLASIDDVHPSITALPPPSPVHCSRSFMGKHCFFGERSYRDNDRHMVRMFHVGSARQCSRVQTEENGLKRNGIAMIISTSHSWLTKTKRDVPTSAQFNSLCGALLGCTAERTKSMATKTILNQRQQVSRPYGNGQLAPRTSVKFTLILHCVVAILHR